MLGIDCLEIITPQFVKNSRAYFALKWSDVLREKQLSVQLLKHIKNTKNSI